VGQDLTGRACTYIMAKLAFTALAELPQASSQQSL
jgi:hypothetical protein